MHNFGYFVIGLFTSSRQVSARFKLQPGTYVIIPSTQSRDEEGEFMLRVLAELPAPIELVQQLTATIVLHEAKMKQLNHCLKDAT